MADYHGPVGPDPLRAAALDDAAQALLATWEAAREQSTPRLSAAQLNALMVVEKEEGINLRGLAGRLRMILSSASRLCDRLVAAGLVERVPGRADRREIALYLTPYSRQLLEDLRAARLAMLGSVLDRMSPTGRAALIRGLTEFAHATAERPNAATAGSDTTARTA